MASNLKALIRLHEWRVDEAQRILGAVAKDLATLESAVETLDGQVAQERQIAEADPDGAGRDYPAYAEMMRHRRHLLQTEITAQAEKVAAARDALRTAFQELKTYQVAQQNRDDKAQSERDKAEQAFLDELGQQRHQRNSR
ncbi:MAG: flagellar FliJ family protein [Magnetospiraceae bacterium]